MVPALYSQRTVLIAGGSFLFKAVGSTLLFDGFSKIYSPAEEDQEKGSKTKKSSKKGQEKIPEDISKGTDLSLSKVLKKQHFSQPPPRYTEASLVKELERRGVGRPSTYATILSVIQKRDYVKKEKKRFFPTELGKTVIGMLVEGFPDIINVEFTARMEDHLDKIASGDEERDEVLLAFYEKFEKDLAEFAKSTGAKKAVPSGISCPECGGNLLIRFGKSGEFLGCENFPECKFTSNFSRDDSGKISISSGDTVLKKTDLKCPKCGKPLVERVGRYGPFLSCSGYPECKYIHQKRLEKACPLCGSDLVERKWNKSSFWGCSSYPKCKFILSSKVIEKKCPDCGRPFLAVKKDRNGGEYEFCFDPACDYGKK